MNAEQLDEIERLVQDAVHGPELAAVIRLAAQPLDVTEQAPPVRRPSPSDLRAATRLAADLELLRVERLPKLFLTAGGTRVPTGRWALAASAAERAARGRETRSRPHAPYRGGRGHRVVLAGAAEWPPPPILISERLVADVRDHAFSAREGFEVAGRLVVETGTRNVVAYKRCRNLATRPGKAIFGSSWRRIDGLDSILLHSHPGASAAPSATDVKFFTSRGRGTEFAIFSPRDDELRVFRVGDDTRPYMPVPVSIR